jgi:8-oxo-dGTP diphosphatase
LARIAALPKKPIVLAVNVLIVDENDRCLVVRRSASSRVNAGSWDFPGGKIEPGESLDQALLREVEEETGLTIELLGVAGAAQAELPDRTVAHLMMHGRTVASAVKLSSEHDDFAWVPRAELPRIELCPQFRAVAEAFAAGR